MIQLIFLLSLVSAIQCEANQSNQQREERPIGSSVLKILRDLLLCVLSHTACGCVRDVFFSWIQDLHLSKSLFTATVPSQCHMIHTSSTIAGTNSSLSHLQDSCRRCWESHTFPTYPLILHRTHHTIAPLWWPFLLLHIDKFFINKKSDLYKDVAAISCKYAQSATRFKLPPRKRSYFCCYIASLHSIKLKMLLLAS